MAFEKICFDEYRLETFKFSTFEKNRRKCTPHNMVEAGFYFTPTETDPDMVTCYACGVEIFGWNQRDDDPWKEHEKIKQDCLYLKHKKGYEQEMTVADFLNIEYYRYQRLASMNYTRRRKAVRNLMDKYIAVVKQVQENPEAPLRNRN